MSNDTLPAPDIMDPSRFSVAWGEAKMLAYGRQCAESARAPLLARIAELGAIVNAQSEDEGLWFIAESASEGYLQQELRKLHAIIDAAMKEQP